MCLRSQYIYYHGYGRIVTTHNSNRLRLGGTHIGTLSITAGSISGLTTLSTSTISTNIFNIGNWQISSSDGHLNFYYSGVQKFVVYNNGNLWTTSLGRVVGDNPRYELRSQSPVLGKCLDVGSNNQDCDWDWGYRLFQIARKTGT